MTHAPGRRAFFKAAGALGLLAALPGCGSSTRPVTMPAPGEPGKFLDAHQLDTLRAVTARFIPGPPDDADPGAVEAGVAEAIDLLLGAFIGGAVPPIHAGGPNSGRNGSTHDDFADFVPLDAHAELGWRMRLEGSMGLPEREFGGPVIGLQQVYRDGLAHLDARSNSRFHVDFVDAAAAEQELMLADLTDGAAQDFVVQALSDTLGAMYGPPEYGGNRGLAGWAYTQWQGDTQPRGSTDAQVTQPGSTPASLSPAAAVALAQKYLGVAGADSLRRGRRRR
jgi:hypothetical protein